MSCRQGERGMCGTDGGASLVLGEGVKPSSAREEEGRPGRTSLAHGEGRRSFLARRRGKEIAPNAQGRREAIPSAWRLGRAKSRLRRAGWKGGHLWRAGRVGYFPVAWGAQEAVIGIRGRQDTVTGVQGGQDIVPAARERHIIAGRATVTGREAVSGAPGGKMNCVHVG